MYICVCVFMCLVVWLKCTQRTSLIGFHWKQKNLYYVPVLFKRLREKIYFVMPPLFHFAI